MGSVIWREISIFYGSCSTSYYFSEALESAVEWHMKIFPRLCPNCRERVSGAVKTAVPVQQRASRGFGEVFPTVIYGFNHLQASDRQSIGLSCSIVVL